MTAIIGFCTKRGAFLAADSRQIDPTTLKPFPQGAMKITRLAPWVVVGIAGNGLLKIADDLSVHTQRSEAAHMSLDEFTNLIRQRLRRAYSASVFGIGKDRAMLTAVLAGHDRAEGRGFVCVFNYPNFRPDIAFEYGSTAWTGPEPALVKSTMATVMDELHQAAPRLRLDRWALESLGRIADADLRVGLPAHMAIVDEHDAVVHEGDRNTPGRDCFLVDFPAAEQFS